MTAPQQGSQYHSTTLQGFSSPLVPHPPFSLSNPFHSSQTSDSPTSPHSQMIISPASQRKQRPPIGSSFHFHFKHNLPFQVGPHRLFHSATGGLHPYFFLEVIPLVSSGNSAYSIVSLVLCQSIALLPEHFHQLLELPKQISLIFNQLTKNRKLQPLSGILSPLATASISLSFPPNQISYRGV